MSIKIFSKLPFELINIIADLHDYRKYCFNDHKEKFREVLGDIHSMAEIMPKIAPKIAYECWGKGAYRLQYLLNNWDEEDDNYGIVGLYDVDLEDDIIIEN
jgi:hypothetical protein